MEVDHAVAGGREQDVVRRHIEENLRDLVESWTRFDSRDLVVNDVSPGTVNASICRAFRISFLRTTEHRPGNGGFGEKCRSADALNLHIDADIRALHDKLPEVLSRWDISNRSELIPDLPLSLITKGGRHAFHDIACQKCNAKGRVNCTACNGQGEDTCHHCIAGRIQCGSCLGMGTRTVNCSVCSGQGRRYENVTFQAWDSNRGQYVYETRVENVTCSACRGVPQRTGSCLTCLQTGRVTCPSCHGSSKVPCSHCAASGQLLCDACAGQRYQHEQYTPAARIDVTWLQAPAETSIEAEVWHAVGQDLTTFVEAWTPGECQIDATGIALVRTVVVPYATASVGLNDDMRTLLAVGPDFSLQRLDGLGNLILDNDAAELEALARRPQSKDARDIAKTVFASEINGRAALLLQEANSKQAPEDAARAVEALVADTRGFLTTGYVERIKSATTELITTTLKQTHARSILIVLAAAVFALAAATVSARWHPLPGRWLWVSIAVLSVAICSEVWLRFRSGLSVRIGKKHKLLSLRHIYARERMWLLAHVLICIAATTALARIAPTTDQTSMTGPTPKSAPFEPPPRLPT